MSKIKNDLFSGLDLLEKTSMVCAAPGDQFDIHDLLSQAMLKPEAQVHVCHPTVPEVYVHVYDPCYQEGHSNVHGLRYFLKPC